MPVCEGRPEGPCPLKKNDKTVHLSQGDLMLCDACERYRFPVRSAPTPAASKLSVSEVRDIPSSKVSSNIGGVEVISFVHDPTSALEVVTLGGTASQMPKLIVSEVLSYLCFYRNSGNVINIKKTLGLFFLPDEISHAK